MSAYYILIYETVSGYESKRVPYRAEHLDLVKHYYDAGQIVMAGAFDPADGAALVFKVNDSFEIENFVAQDPYVKQGLITKWHIKKWSVVIGG